MANDFVSRDYLLERVRMEGESLDRQLSRPATWAAEDENMAFGAMNYAAGIRAALESFALIINLPASAERDRAMLNREDYP